ncbi:MAG: hypothetical protein RBS51_05285 [Anaerovoracaceae bacterium]|jgi:hypothetical protein|nr:hypothetical protein [Anaerovoracaceae bacterium]
MKKEYTVALFNEDYDHVEELIRRGRMRRYFQGPPKWHHRESVGVVFGGLLSLAFGLFIPILLMNSGLNPMGLKAASFILVLGGAFLLVKGYLEVTKDYKKVYEEIPDEEWEKCLSYDLNGIMVKAKGLLSEKLDNFINGVEAIEELETLIVTGVDDWASNPNLPLLMTMGQDGVIRPSNLGVMIIFLSKEHFYVYQCSYNMRSGGVRREHAYTCAYEDFLGAEIRKGEKRTLVTDKKIVNHKILEFVLFFQKEEQEELSLVISDIDTEKGTGGKFDISASEKALERMNQIVGDKRPKLVEKKPNKNNQ